ncbi:hypothetical protein CDD83_1156 [Cordyceps sp. RAO-2017]|nr:hypothetical protein CDD83_1156 [Cordyceps sp. RAO-2017]
MPCCIAVIQYGQCRHSTLFKLGCTAGCEALCAAEQQELTLQTRFRWQCEECHAMRHAVEANGRSETWNERAQIIADGKGEDESDGQREMRVLALRDREEYEEELLEERRVAQVEEIQYAEQWTVEYGRLLYVMRYGRRRGPDRPRPASPSPETMDVPTGAEHDDDEAEEAQQGEERQQEQQTKRKKGKKKNRPWPQQQQQQRRPAPGQEGGGAAGEYQQPLQRLRSLRQWDLAVLRDTSRSDKELREQRDEARRLVRREGT